MPENEKLFPLGKTVMTPGAIEALCKGVPHAEKFDELSKNMVASVRGGAYLRKHQSGDWGVMCAEDKAENDRALKAGDRLMSGYDLPEIDHRSERIWIITEWDRSVTTILLPEEY